MEDPREGERLAISAGRSHSAEERIGLAGTTGAGELRRRRRAGGDRPVRERPEAADRWCGPGAGRGALVQRAVDRGARPGSDHQGATPGIRRGVHIFLDNFGTAKHIVQAGMYVHDVNGGNDRKDNGGIIFRTNGNQTPSRFDGLIISAATASCHGRRTACSWNTTSRATATGAPTASTQGSGRGVPTTRSSSSTKRRSRGPRATARASIPTTIRRARCSSTTTATTTRVDSC